MLHQSRPSVAHVVGICVALGIPYFISMDVLGAAGIRLRAIEIDYIYREFLMNAENPTVSRCEDILKAHILDNMDEDQKWRNIENDLKNIVSEISPTQIRFFDNSSDWVDAMELLVKNGKHTVDTASLDSSTRTKSPNSRSRIWNHITDCCKNENIKFRHIVRVRKNNYSNLLDRLLAGSEKENSFYAYYELPQTFSFPTFGIIDDRFISTRSPYSEGETPRYYIIENKEIA